MSVLDQIVTQKKSILSANKAQITLEKIKELAQDKVNDRRFLYALKKQNKSKYRIIAEIKKASPSKGIICHNFNPTDIATSYQRGGACCLSVLTDVEFFQGNNDYIRQAKLACTLPILRKDFIIDEWQIYESVYIGADAILLICSILTDKQLHNLHNLANEYQLDCLVEVHDEKEMERALKLQAQLIGINNRNLHTFATELQTSVKLASHAKSSSDVMIISESGIHTREDIEMLANSGIDGFLIGEACMKTDDPGIALQALIS